jgi:hypothetical protein
MRHTLTVTAGLIVRIGSYRLRVIDVVGPHNIHVSTYNGRTHYLDASVLTEIYPSTWVGVTSQPPSDVPLLIVEV